MRGRRWCRASCCRCAVAAQAVERCCCCHWLLPEAAAAVGAAAGMTSCVLQLQPPLLRRLLSHPSCRSPPPAAALPVAGSAQGTPTLCSSSRSSSRSDTWCAAPAALCMLCFHAALGMLCTLLTVTARPGCSTSLLQRPQPPPALHPAPLSAGRVPCSRTCRVPTCRVPTADGCYFMPAGHCAGVRARRRPTGLCAVQGPPLRCAGMICLLGFHLYRVYRKRDCGSLRTTSRTMRWHDCSVDRN